MHTSAETAELDKALAAAQSEFPRITKDQENPFYKSKYMDLAGLINAVQPVLGKYCLALRQHLETDSVPLIDSNGEIHGERLFVCVITRLSHSSGQFEESTLKVPLADQKPQTLGSTSSYARRYSLQAVLRIAAEDDDGNAASLNETWTPEQRALYISNKKKKLAEPKQSQQPKDLTQITEADIAAALNETLQSSSANSLISKAQQQLLHIIRRKLQWEDAAFRDFLGSHGFERSAEIPITKYQELLDEIDPEFKEHKKTTVKQTPK